MIPTELHISTKNFLKWGRLSLRDHIDQQELLETLEQEIFSYENLGLELLHDLDLIIKDALEALDFLNQPDILDIKEDDSAEAEALESFVRLDQLVFFKEAAERLLVPKEEKLAEELLQATTRAYEQVTSFFFSPDFSALRLTVFQEYRKNALIDIRPEQYYLFPWYDLFNNVNSDTLFLIAENINQPENLPREIKDELPLFYAEIQQDKVLNKYIHEQHRLSRQFNKILETHWLLRLWRFVEQISLDKILPEMVEQKGVVRLRQSLVQSSGLTDQDRFALGLSAALFAPDIDEAERLKLLEQCEKIFERVRETSTPNTPPDRVIQKLNQFQSGRLSLEEAVQATLDYWIEQLSTVQAEERKSKSDIAGLVRSIISVDDSDGTEKITYRPQRPASSIGKDKSKPWLEKLKAWLGKPIVLIPALAVFLIMISFPLIMRQQDFMHMNFEMLVYKTQPLIHSDEAETVIARESGAVLSSQDCFQLLFTPTRDVYAYLLHQDTQGRVTKYFEGKLHKDQTRVFPDEESRDCFTEDSGSEVFYLVYFEDAADGFDELAYQLSKVEDPLDPGQFEQEVENKFPDALIEKFTFSYN